MAGRAREIPCPPGTAEPSVWPSQCSRQPQWGAGLPSLGQWDHSLPGMLSLLPPFLLPSGPAPASTHLCVQPGPGNHILGTKQMKMHSARIHVQECSPQWRLSPPNWKQPRSPLRVHPAWTCCSPALRQRITQQGKRMSWLTQPGESPPAGVSGISRTQLQWLRL